jgi:enoyl-CoA hydratase/carnithine racemase
MNIQATYAKPPPRQAQFRKESRNPMPDILLSISAPCATLILNRPEKKNALTMAMWDALPGLIAQAANVPGVRLIVLTGAGGAFAAGADIAEFESVYADRASALDNHRRIQAAMSAVEDCPVPTVAMIEGACVGGGCGLALACDLRFAADTARFGITPGKLGLAYGIADTRRLVAAVGLSAAKDILFTGRLFDAARAVQIGLIDRCVAPAALAGAVDGLAADLAAASSFTAAATKKILRLLGSGLQDDNDVSRALFADAFEGPDFREGRAAFLEKRKATFS